MRARTVRVLGLTVAMAIAVAACTGTSDDDDDGISPSPTPSFVPIGCEIVWVSPAAGGGPGLIDFYIVDSPVSAWVTGTHQYGSPATGRFFRAYDLASEEEAFAASAVASNGSYALLAVSTSAGGFVEFTDSTSQEYLLLDTAGAPGASTGTGGTGSFAGYLSDPFSANVDPGQGTIQIMFQGTSFELGTDYSYSVCYDEGTPLRPFGGPGWPER